MIKVAIAADRHVASMTALKSSPVGVPLKLTDNIAGLTKIIYAIVRNVVIPAISSVLTHVLFSFNLKALSSISNYKLYTSA